MIDALSEPNEKLREFGMGGITNFCLGKERSTWGFLKSLFFSVNITLYSANSFLLSLFFIFSKF